MPDYFSHTVVAEKVFERLDQSEREILDNKTLYLLGAQGPDVLFAYNAKLTRTNYGRLLHRENALEIIKKLMDGNKTYAAGFATHYALDCTMHPAVYAYETSRKGPFLHQKFEGDLGLYISKFYAIRRTILPRERVLSCTFQIYDSLKLIAPQITVTGVERCLKRHFSYTRYLYKVKRQSYKCDYDFSSLAGAVEEAVDLGVQCVKCVLENNIDEEIFSKSFLQK